MKDTQVYAGATMLGAISGMRSMSGTAIVSQLAKAGSVALGNSGAEILGNPITARTLTVLAVAEAVADKLPFIPKRTSPIPLIARAVTGAVAGASVSLSRKRSLLVGGLLGAVGAIGASYLAYELRRRATEDLHVPNVVAGLAEDALVATAGWLVSSKLRASELV
jgi:uncharacterized membrane protein